MNRNFDSHEHDETCDERDQDVEQAVMALRLRKPSADLDRRIFGSLATGATSIDTPTDAVASANSDQTASTQPHPSHLVFTRWLAGAAAVAACAALVILVILSSQPTNSTQPTDGNLTVDFDPVRIEHVYSDVEPEGVVFVDDNTPMQRYRRQTVEHVQLIDAERDIRIELTVPKEDLIVMPVSYD